MKAPNKNPKVLFCCDGGMIPEIGTGHIIRDLEIANSLVAKSICNKNQIAFATRCSNKFRFGYEKVLNSGYKHYPIGDFKNSPEWNTHEEANIISDIGAEVLILDRHFPTEYDWLSKARTNSCGVASLRNFQEKMRVLPSFISRFEGGKGFEEIANVLLQLRLGS